jgi:hypothetical protein
VLERGGAAGGDVAEVGVFVCYEGRLLGNSLAVVIRAMNSIPLKTL